MKDLYQKIQGYFDLERSDNIVRSIFQSLVLLTSGAFLGLILTDLSATPSKVKWQNIVLCLIATVAYVYLEYRRLRKEKSFPITILQHLNATSDLDEVRKQYNRKTKVDEYIDHSIRSLNSNTCPVSLPAEDFTICHQDLNAGLKNVLLDVVEKPHYVFDVDKSKFLVGTYLRKIYNPVPLMGEINAEEKFFIFRDDFNFSDYFPFSLYTISDKPDTFNIQTSIIESINLEKYVCKDVIFNNKHFTFISSPIPNVCESCPPDGAIFCIYEGVEKCPSDIENVLLIFARIVSNWISKFNDCVLREKNPSQEKLSKRTEAEIPPEVLSRLKNKQANISRSEGASFHEGLENKSN